MGNDLEAWLRSFGRRRVAQEKESPSLNTLREGEYPCVPIKLTDTDLDQAIQRFPVLVVDCWAPWCQPCLMVAPVIAELAEDYKGKIVFGKLNVDENPETAVKYGIRSIPALLVFQKGKIVDLIIGAQPRQALEAQITKYLEQP
ncbi:MAG: thioredoxin [Candidatus Latescibacterota bacterium]|nr:MAG: thioredoxin [Candidatus Latescibacterota bacterium]RKY70529.1 MAG: thioredoxin [Candidatus Latescibacterota bacterium]